MDEPYTVQRPHPAAEEAGPGARLLLRARPLSSSLGGIGDKVLETKAGLARASRKALGGLRLPLRGSRLGRPETRAALSRQLPASSDAPRFLKHVANWEPSFLRQTYW